MNVNDSDIVRSLLLSSEIFHFQEVDDENDADVLLTNTCAIREGAEQKVWGRLHQIRAEKKRKQRKDVVVGVLGCMAERLKEDLLKDGMADMVVGPDSYRDVPKLVQGLLSLKEHNNTDPERRRQNAINVQLSMDETYADITPVRHHAADPHAAFVSIQRGCSNRCSFCIVPFTRGTERSRPLDSIVDEVRRLHLECNIKEVTLLGQNVNSYHDRSDAAIALNPGTEYRMSNTGFQSRIRRPDAGYFFADLLAAVADIAPDQLRVRFTSPHPKDYPQPLLQLMAERPNVCNCLHMPAQSGSTSMLRRMKRGYTREAYLQLMTDVRSLIPDVGISSDFIAGFCDETEEEHADTVSLLEQVRYDQAFMFMYSMRGQTHAARTMEDNVPQLVKQRRLQEIMKTFSQTLHQKNVEQEIGRLRLILVEGEVEKSKRKTSIDSKRIQWRGSTDQNKRILFSIDSDDDGDSAKCLTDQDVQPLLHAFQNKSIVDPSTHRLNQDMCGRLRKGDYAVVVVTEAEGCRLRGKLLWRTDSIRAFQETGLTEQSNGSVELAKYLRKESCSEVLEDETSMQAAAL